MPLGTCHICQHIAFIKYCELCKHWFCDKCRKKYFSRGIAAVKEMLSKAKKGCCGPN